MEKLYTLSEASRIFGVSISMLPRWDREGKIRAVRTAGGHRRIPERRNKETSRRKVPSEIHCVIYARVSSQKQAEQGDLDRQIEALRKYAEERNWEIVDVIKDIASGLKESRKGLRNLFNYVASKNRCCPHYI